MVKVRALAEKWTKRSNCNRLWNARKCKGMFLDLFRRLDQCVRDLNVLLNVDMMTDIQDLEQRTRRSVDADGARCSCSGTIEGKCTNTCETLI